MDSNSFASAATKVLAAIQPLENYQLQAAWLQQEPAIRIPAVLRTFYQFAADSESVMASHHRFVPLADLALSEGGLVFCEENERVVYWGINAELMDVEDPPVMQWNTVGNVWCEDCPRLSLFLLNMICWQVLNAATAVGRTQYDHGVAAWIGRQFMPVSNDADQYDLMSYYANGIVACLLMPKLIFVGCADDYVLTQFEQNAGAQLDRI